ncbi:unnamed protein product, partial [Closterium sp. Naga37s-1]
ASPDMAAARAEALLPRERSECNLQGGHEQHLHHHHHGFGDKTITFWGSCVLNFNNITGPAVVVLPLLYAQAGWFLPTAGLTLMWLFSSFAATMMCEAQQRIPGNKGFARRFEYCTLVRHYFGDRWYALAQIGFNTGLLASNIASMIVTSQVLDSVVYRLAGTSYGMDYGQWPPAFIESLATGGAGGNVCAWGTTSSGDCNRSVISLGFVLAMTVCIPFARLNLDDNMGFQWLSMLAQLLFSFEFAAQFLSNLLPGSPNYCPGNGPGRTPFLGLDISQVLGVCVFAYSYVSTIPSWANEKKPGVNVNRAIWLPASVGCALNILLGLLGAWAYKLVDDACHPFKGTNYMLTCSHAPLPPAPVSRAPMPPCLALYPAGLLGAWAYKLVDDAGHPFKGTDNMLNMLDGQADAATACGHPHVACTCGASLATSQAGHTNPSLIPVHPSPPPSVSPATEFSVPQASSPTPSLHPPFLPPFPLLPLPHSYPPAPPPPSYAPAPPFSLPLSPPFSARFLFVLQVAPATEFSVYMWGFFGYIPGIPILAIMVRYNLQSSGLFSDSAAFFWAVVAPWLLTAFFYQAQRHGYSLHSSTKPRCSCSCATGWPSFARDSSASSMHPLTLAHNPPTPLHPSASLQVLVQLCNWVLVQLCNWVAIICHGFINLIQAATNRYPPFLHCVHPSVLVQFCNWVAIICQGFINLVVPTLLFRAALITYPTPEELESRGYLLVSSSPPSSTPLSTTPHTSTPLRSSSSADRSLAGLIQNVIAALSPKHSPNSSEGGAGVMESDMEGAGAYKQMPDGAAGEPEQVRLQITHTASYMWFE